MGKPQIAKSSQLQQQAADRFAGLSSTLGAEASPLRNQVSSYYSGILKGGPAGYAVISPQVDFAKTQFNNARRTFSQTTPAGGADIAGNRALAGTEAQTISSMYRDQINKALEALTGISMGETQGAISSTGGVSSAAGALGTLGAQQAQAWSSGLSGLGGALGTFFGLRHAGGTT